MGIAEVRIVVSGKKLYEVLESLEGKCLQPPLVITVPEHKGNGVDTDMIGGQPRKGKGLLNVGLEVIKGKKRITTGEIRQAVIEAGFVKGSTGYIMKQLKRKGILKSTRERGIWEVHLNG
jgi:hypothetical protein